MALLFIDPKALQISLTAILLLPFDVERKRIFVPAGIVDTQHKNICVRCEVIRDQNLCILDKAFALHR